jgi:hypothetical protein
MRAREIAAAERPAAACAADRVFYLALALSLALWSYAVSTTSIDSFDFEPLPMLSRMPATFWVGGGFLVVATIAWYLSPRTRRVHSLLALSWALFVLLGPELMEVNARGSDTFGHLVGVTFYDQGRYDQPDVVYSAFPGFHFLAIPLMKATGVEYVRFAKLLAVILHVARLVAIVYLGSHLFKERKEALFFVLLLLALLWDNQQMDPSNQNLGLTYLLFFLAVLLTPGPARWERRLVSLVFLVATVITHPLSAVVLIAFLAFFLLAGLGGVRFGYFQTAKGFTLLLLAVASFCAWISYVGDWVLVSGLEKMMTFLGEEKGQLTENITEANDRRSFYAVIVYALFALLLFWGLAVVLRKDFLTRLSVRRVLPALAILPPLPALALGFWTIERYYLLATIGIAWFLAQERATRKHLALFLLVVLLGFSFTLRYYTEYIDYSPSEDFSVARFVTGEIPDSAVVYRGHKASPTFVNLSDRLESPGWVDATEVRRYGLRPGVDFQFAIDSEREKNIVIFRNGYESWARMKEVLASHEPGYVYSNGAVGIRMYEPEAGSVSIPSSIIEDRH